jgi:hypothetical protein
MNLDKYKKDLSDDEILLCKKIAKHKNVTAAYMELHPYLPEKTASAIVRNKINNSPIMRNLISSMLDDKKLSLNDLNSQLKDLTHANKPVVVNNSIVDYPDNNIRLAAIEKAYKLHGLLKNDVQIDNRQVNIEVSDISDESQQRLSSILDEMSKLNDKLDLNKNKVKYVDTNNVT